MLETSNKLGKLLQRLYLNRSLALPLARKLARDPKDFLRLTKSWAQGSLPPLSPALVGAPPRGLPPYTCAFAGTEPIAFRTVPALSRRPYLNVVLPGWAVHRMSGGPNTIINLTYRMAAKGVPVRYICASSPAEIDPEPMWRHVHELTGIRERFPHVEAVCGHDRGRTVDIGENDVFMATAWWTAHIVQKALGLTRHRKFLYVIQDYEPGLYPWSTEHALALETYDWNYCAIVNSRLLADYFLERKIGPFGKPGLESECAVLETAVDRACFHFDDARPKDPGRRKRLLFYARPTTARRNLYELGVAALIEASRRNIFSEGEWDLFFMGERIQSLSVPGVIEIQCLPWLGYEAYAAQLRGSDVVLSLMLSPHSSYPPLEAAACGALVVTNIFDGKTAARLTDLSRNIIPVTPSIEGVVGGLRSAVRSVDDFASRREHSRLGLPVSWEEAFASVLPRAMKMWEECLASSDAKPVSRVVHRPTGAAPEESLQP